MRVVSLFDRTGSWSAPWLEAGHIVERVELSDGNDVRLWDPRGVADVVLAAPPCQALGRLRHFSSMTLGEGLALVRRTVELVAAMQPRVWCVENPYGSLAGLVLGRATIVVKWSDYGWPVCKKTSLWGVFVPPVPSTLGAIPTHVIGSYTNATGLRTRPRINGKLNDVTPPAFARAFYEANRG